MDKNKIESVFLFFSAILALLIVSMFFSVTEASQTIRQATLETTLVFQEGEGVTYTGAYSYVDDNVVHMDFDVDNTIDLEFSTPYFAQNIMRVMSSDKTAMSNLESGIKYTFSFYQEGYYLELHAYWEDNDVTVEEI